MRIRDFEDAFKEALEQPDFGIDDWWLGMIESCFNWGSKSILCEFGVTRSCFSLTQSCKAIEDFFCGHFYAFWSLEGKTRSTLENTIVSCTNLFGLENPQRHSSITRHERGQENTIVVLTKHDRVIILEPIK